MEIIIKGHLPPKKKYHIFNCLKCECIFKASEDEYTYNYYYNTSIASCPNCDNLVTTKGDGIEDKFNVF